VSAIVRDPTEDGRAGTRIGAISDEIPWECRECATGGGPVRGQQSLWPTSDKSSPSSLATGSGNHQVNRRFESVVGGTNVTESFEMPRDPLHCRRAVRFPMGGKDRSADIVSNMEATLQRLRAPMTEDHERSPWPSRIAHRIPD
jgi:hypothetical protein